MKKIKILCGIVLFIVLFFTIINLIPPTKNVETNPFIVKDGKLPMIAAHRGGADNFPENTMLAFKSAIREVGIDILESDIYLTKDNHLVFNHDEYIDSTCDINGDITKDEIKDYHYIKDMTLAELQQYNFGYFFKDESDNRIYKNETNIKEKGLQIISLEEMFEEFYLTNPDLLFIIEIKNSGELGYKACKKLDEVLSKYPSYKDNIVIGTFHDEIEKELKEKYPYLLRGAPTTTAAKFVISQLLGVNLFNKSDFACLQIPTSFDIGIDIPLDLKTIIKRAHKRNIAVQYWTINNEDEMRKLIELGCDCIMTDNPILLKQILQEYQ